ncbi:MAG: ATP-binding cassette domain-containing protein, partial [Thermoanaerobaculia bacterium]|nr:ATP-binding cassette domain-containing protein [Thermoanaerobaculia bacterium]
RGSVTALVGPSGGGKSTLVSLLPRFMDPSAGRVLVDGTDVRGTTLASLRAQIGLVTQETVLFDESIRRNVAYGRPDASDGDVRAALAAANALAFVVALPAGIDTRVGEAGSRLSGGQRQRLAIARALLKNAPILILDEATSALDAESERAVQEALERLMAGRTVLVIAHRLSTVRRADQLVVLDAGRIVERGRHAELLAAGGMYRRLHDLQMFEAPGGAPEAGSDAS